MINKKEKLLLLERQYKLAIDARDKLNDNFHKWMTFYYIANSAILVAITTLFKENKLDRGIIVLSLLGVLICVFWNLSCKGYYYWSKSWIEIIIRIEKNIINEDTMLGVYSIFSKEVAETKMKSTNIIGFLNISTPKLTMIFSFCGIVGWMIFSCYHFFIQYDIEWGYKILIVVLLIILVSSGYYKYLPRKVMSREGETHDLV